jgi:hypothetical protein
MGGWLRTGSTGNSDELPGSLKGGGFYQLSDSQLLKKGSAPRS